MKWETEGRSAERTVREPLFGRALKVRTANANPGAG